MYAKIFEQIFYSSIADDYELRHFFVDMLVLADENGYVDMTPSSIAAKTRIPIEKVLIWIQKLELPDPHSRTPDNGGIRIRKMFEDRDWGWEILNYRMYREIATEKQRKELINRRVKDYRSRTSQVPDVKAGNAVSKKVEDASAFVASFEEEKGSGKGRMQKPTVAEIKLLAIKRGMPAEEGEKFFNYYESNGWRVGRNPMRSWEAALANWKRHWIEYGGGTSKPKNNLEGCAP